MFVLTAIRRSADAIRPATPLRHLLILAALLCAAVGAVADPRVTALTVNAEERQVRVTGITPDHQAIVFSVGIGSIGNTPALTREARALTDDDGDGTVELTVHRLPSRSVWVAIDVESGDVAVATPDGSLPATLPRPENAWLAGQERVAISRSYVEAVVVRPAVGAWAARLADGGSRDADSLRNGISTFRLDAMQRIGGTENGPPLAQPNDILIVADPQTLELIVSEVH
ncbi:MAG TPA: hypothetical protein VHW00_23825 [Thermoanaerobaculia bacterium]|nr:hypothetical protein [Thermoanaerobaculia bacterium]